MAKPSINNTKTLEFPQSSAGHSLPPIPARLRQIQPKGIGPPAIATPAPTVPQVFTLAAFA